MLELISKIIGILAEQGAVVQRALAEMEKLKADLIAQPGVATPSAADQVLAEIRAAEAPTAEVLAILSQRDSYRVQLESLKAKAEAAGILL